MPPTVRAARLAHGRAFIYACSMQQNRLPLPLVVITFANMTLLGFLNSMRGVSFPLIRNSFNASYNHMGLMNALTLISMVCFCLASGYYMNRFGLKKNIITGFLFILLGAASLYFSSGFWIALGLYLILQAGFGFFEIGLNGMGVRIFTVKTGLMMNLLHFSYGVGAIIGPRFMGYAVNHGFRWQEVYPMALVPALVLLAVSLALRFPARPESTKAVEVPSFWRLLNDPMVWLFGIIIGLGSAIEGCSVAWSGLYLFDVYGLEPSTAGAVFVSAFYAVFTVSRLFSGFVIEKIGYLKSVHIASFAIFVIFALAFSLGRNGIYLLPLIGFFVAIIWPTVLSISAGVFKERAQTASSAIICIAFALNGTIQYMIGLINRFIGASWGYRSCLLYSAVLIILLFRLWHKSIGAEKIIPQSNEAR